MQCTQSVLDQLLTDLADFVSHGPECHLVFFVDNAAMESTAASENAKGTAVRTGDIWLSPVAYSEALMDQIRDVLGGRSTRLDAAALRDAGVAFRPDQ